MVSLKKIQLASLIGFYACTAQAEISKVVATTAFVPIEVVASPALVPIDVVATHVASVKSAEVAPTPTATATPAPVYSSLVSAAAADDMAMTALTLMGTPYRFGGTSPDSGFDCSGLVQYIYRDISQVTLPRTAAQMATLAGHEVTVNDLVVGDLLFFRLGRSSSINHVAVYIGENRFVHAPRSGSVVRIDKLNDKYWMRYFDKARRLFSDDGHLQDTPPRLSGAL